LDARECEQKDTRAAGGASFLRVVVVVVVVMAGGGDADDDDDGVTLEELVKVRASFFLSSSSFPIRVVLLV
jgi:hypothetical protein